MDIFQTLPTTINLDPEEDFQIVRAELLHGEKMYLAIDVLNIYKNAVAGVVFQVRFKDAGDNYLFGGLEWLFQTQGMKALPNIVYYIKPFLLDERFYDARSVEIRVESITFDDGKISKFSSENKKSFILPVITGEKLKKIRDILGKEITTYGENTVNGWRCVCGFTNTKEDEECRNCNRNKNFVLNNLTEPLINLKLMSMLTEDEIANGLEGENISATYTQTQLTKVAPNPEVVELERVNEEPVGINYKKPSIFLRIFKTTFKVLLLAVLIVSIAFVGGKYYGFQKNAKTLERANELVLEGKYEDALKEYEKINKKFKREEVETKVSNVKELIKSKNLFDEGNDSILKGDYLEAAKKFKKVSEKDEEHFKEAQDKILDLERIFLDKAEALEDEGKVKEAIKTLEDFLAVVPDSANATTILMKLQANATDNIEPISLNLEGSEDKDADEKEKKEEVDKSRADLSNEAKSLLNTYQKVKIGKANLRKGPSLDSEIVQVLNSNTDLYIKDTKLESDIRVWCFVEAKDENGKTYEGWISNKAME
ncbi:SH3 domain-containing protein [Peptoniphilus duerdenii]|uniref:SH3 domain-containing protein n=1 Tax=Peptoniphilus duerdenii TaxID=507750 RepID=UPI00288B1DBE|nr:SH3 domain-containing protein [Peptoniphilus duerdenii]